LATPQLSLGVAAKLTLAVHWPGSALAAMLAGAPTVGGWLSVTMTVWVQAFTLLCSSVAVQVTVVVPTEKCAGASLPKVTPPQVSEAMGAPRLTPLAKH